MFQPVDVLVVVPSDTNKPLPGESAADSSSSSSSSTSTSNINCSKSDDVWIRVSLLDRGVEPDDPSVLPQVSGREMKEEVEGISNIEDICAYELRVRC